MARMGGLAAFAAALWLWPAIGAGAEAWPGRQVKIVVAFAPGGSADQFGRLLAAELSAAFKQQFFVENRPGNSGAIGSAQVARSEPDGYTLLIAGPARTSRVPQSIRISATIRLRISPISR
jgi:tripartite-type tricarboxylate transporter receptor subunit TctC